MQSVTLWQAFALLELSILIIILLFGFNQLSSATQQKTKQQSPSEDLNQLVTQSEFQAIFLDNGQVYFGQINKINNKQLFIKNIYYLQSDRSAKVTEKNKSQDIKLIKFGHELHNPKDEMLINQEHVLFIENLKSDSKVVKAIKEQSKK